MGAFRTLFTTLAVVVSALTVPFAASAAGAATTSGPTEISMTNSAFGKILVVGSGQYQGYSVYFLTSDNPPSFGCTTTIQQLPPGPIACTGPEGGQSEWPAVTTTGTPVAGSGVKQNLLGMLFRSDLGTNQVTYGGHPLYLFDMSAGQITGEPVCPRGTDSGIWCRRREHRCPGQECLPPAPLTESRFSPPKRRPSPVGTPFPCTAIPRASAPVRALLHGHRY